MPIMISADIGLARGERAGYAHGPLDPLLAANLAASAQILIDPFAD